MRILNSGVNALKRHSFSSRSSLRDTHGLLEDLPVVTMPHKVVQIIDRQKDKKEQEKKRSRPLKVKGPLIISCQRKSYNFRKQEKFNKETDFFKLVSCGWKNRKRIGDQFTLVPYANNPSLQDENAETFSDLGLTENLCETLLYLGYETPTHIQRQAIPAMLRGDNVVCAAETGSGKTLSYLLPTLERISRLKDVMLQHQRMRRGSRQEVDGNLGNPNTVILSPNRELCHQALDVAQSLSASLDISTQCVVGGTKVRSELRQFRDAPMDVLISTPGTLTKLLSSKCLRRSNLQSLIIDESDTLLDDSFLPDIHEIFDRFQVSLQHGLAQEVGPMFGGVQLSLVSATMPRDLNGAVGHLVEVDSMTKVTTRGLHRLMPHVSQTFHRINPDNKPGKLIEILKTSGEKRRVCLVFAKNSQTCFFLRNLLRDNDLDCLTLNGELTAKERDGVFSRFKEGYSDILVATDIASRGLDTTNVDHVINYDFPSFLSDYVHRVGRVGRVGARTVGSVTSLVAHKWEVDLLWKIEMAARMGTKLDNVNANIKRKLVSSHDEMFTVNELS